MLNQNLLFFNIGGGELMIIVLFIIMFFGADKIPELARTIGKGMREIKNATDGIKEEIRESTKDISGITGSVDIKRQVSNFIEKSMVEETKSKNEITEQPSQPNTVAQSIPNQEKTETPI